MIKVPLAQSTDVLTDWAETSCLFGSGVSLADHQLEATLDEAGVPDPDTVVFNIRLQIELRHCMANGTSRAHPVESIEGGLRRLDEWERNPAYAFQLLLACQSYYRDRGATPPDWNATAKLFERISTLALERYMAGRAVNVGHPRDGKIPRGFSQCLDYLCKILEEARGPIKSYGPHSKDDGVDVVAWRPFGDGRPGQMVVLAQCAAGSNWKNRTGAVKLKKWAHYIDWLVDPLKAFAFPYVCLDTLEWKLLHQESEGLVLDRLRISSMFILADESSTTVQVLLAELRDWCQVQLPRLPWLV